MALAAPAGNAVASTPAAATAVTTAADLIFEWNTEYVLFLKQYLRMSV